MNQTSRLYQIERLIRDRGCVSRALLCDRLEISRATLKRDLEYLRDRLGAPIVYDRERNGYRFDGAPGAGSATGSAAAPGARQELPGLWFNERELYALLMAHQLLAGIDDDGTLGRHLQPLLARIHQLLGPEGDAGLPALMQRVKILGAWKRPVAPECFERAAEALLRRRRLQMHYLTRARGSLSQREVSPQRLVHYRNTWYLDAWCHRREALLRFALDAVQQAQVLDSPARELPLDEVQAEMDRGYGIFAGGRTQRALLRFSAQAAPWISREQWHPEQQGRLLDDGRWELALPFVDATELAMDILRHGADVQVLAPASLRQLVREKLQAAAAQYA